MSVVPQNDSHLQLQKILYANCIDQILLQDFIMEIA